MALSTKSLATRSNFVVYCALILIFKTIMNINSNTQVLSNAEMKCIVGGFDGNRKTECESGATVRCNQNTTETKSVANCNRSTVESACGGNATNAVCIC